MPVIAFLDNNILNALVDGDCAFTIDDLVEAHRGGRLEIVGSIELLEEVMGTFGSRPRKFRKLWKLWRKVIGRRIIAPIDQRHRLELLTGGKLAVDQRYLPRSAVRQLGSLVARSAAVTEINSLVRVRKQKTLRGDQSLKVEILSEIEKQGKRIKDFDRRVSIEFIAESVEHVVAVGPEHGLPSIDTEEISYERLPSIWLLCGVTAARATRMAGENRKVKASDNHDRLHASAGAYFDVLVTNDVEFRQTLALIPELPFEVCSSAEFESRLSAP